jgi:hypothetical protein
MVGILNICSQFHQDYGLWRKDGISSQVYLQALERHRDAFDRLGRLAKKWPGILDAMVDDESK